MIIKLLRKKVTIYHVWEQLGMSCSYVSGALNQHPSVSKDVVEPVKKTAAGLEVCAANNYRMIICQRHESYSMIQPEEARL